MNDRFKFRGVLTVEYGGDNADDKTVDLIIEKADAIYSGDIGFDIDQLDAAIEKAGITDDIEIDNIHEFCYDNNGCRNDEYFVIDGDIEQCTGLKDKKGNLIYEGDIVKYSYSGKGVVRFGKYTGCFACGWDIIYQDLIGWYLDDYYDPDESERLRIDTDNTHSPITEEDVSDFEIIGNIHEQAEQKDVK